VQRGTTLRTALLLNGLSPHNGRAQLIHCWGPAAPAWWKSGGCARVIQGPRVFERYFPVPSILDPKQKPLQCSEAVAPIRWWPCTTVGHTASRKETFPPLLERPSDGEPHPCSYMRRYGMRRKELRRSHVTPAITTVATRCRCTHGTDQDHALPCRCMHWTQYKVVQTGSLKLSKGFCVCLLLLKLVVFGECVRPQWLMFPNISGAQHAVHAVSELQCVNASCHLSP